MTEIDLVNCPNCGRKYDAKMFEEHGPFWTHRCDCGIRFAPVQPRSQLIQFENPAAPQLGAPPPTGDVSEIDDVQHEDGDEFRCVSCGNDRIGIWRDGVLHLKYRERTVYFQGVAWVPCRKCNHINVVSSGSGNVAFEAAPDINSLLPDDLTLPETIDATNSAVALASELGIDIAAVPGTGKDGRITKPDVQKYLDEEVQDV